VNLPVWSLNVDLTEHHRLATTSATFVSQTVQLGPDESRSVAFDKAVSGSTMLFDEEFEYDVRMGASHLANYLAHDGFNDRRREARRHRADGLGGRHPRPAASVWACPGTC
jgi:hypothetical protein